MLKQRYAALDRVTPFAKLLIILSVVFIEYFTIGLALPVLPLHVHDVLGLSTLFVGVIVGSQFASTLLSAFLAGSYTDKYGARSSMIIGLLLTVLTALLYLISLKTVETPIFSASLLLIGRILLGSAESFITIGALSWGTALLGAEKTGKTMAWVGMFMYAAFAVAAPFGSFLYAKSGFSSIAFATVLAPLFALIFIYPLRVLIPVKHNNKAFFKVLKSVLLPGAGLVLGSIGFGAVTIFITLYFAEQSWGLTWLAFTAFSLAFILVRLFLGHLPDKIGGIRIAFYCIFVEALGLFCIYIAPSPFWALFGCFLTGAGYSLIYPGFGVEAMRRTSLENRSLAMGLYGGFFDGALGIASPILGLVAGKISLSAVYFISMLVVLSAFVVASKLLAQKKRAN